MSANTTYALNFRFVNQRNEKFSYHGGKTDRQTHSRTNAFFSYILNEPRMLLFTILLQIMAFNLKLIDLSIVLEGKQRTSDKWSP